MALRFFKEDYPELHVVAAGSLLEFTLQELPTFGVGRIHSLFMYPLTFDEFLYANGEEGLLEMRQQADAKHPLEKAFHDKLTEYFRIYLLVGGMPEAVRVWVATKDFVNCHHVHADIVLAYEDDFSKYKKRVNPDLLRDNARHLPSRLAKNSLSSKFQPTTVAHKSERLSMLSLAGLVTPVVATAGNGVPLDAEADEARMKALFLDPGLLLSVLQLESSTSQEIIEQILTASPQELVNKGGLVEMVAGLEIMRNKPCVQRQKMFFWEKKGNSVAEVDYLGIHNTKVIPVEVKSRHAGRHEKPLDVHARSILRKPYAARSKISAKSAIPTPRTA